jgi:hypothetical protein
MNNEEVVNQEAPKASEAKESKGKAQPSNQDITFTEPVVKAGGDNTVSFDELESVMAQKERAKQLSPKKEDKKEDETPKEEKKEVTQSKEVQKDIKDPKDIKEPKKEDIPSDEKDLPLVKHFSVKNGHHEVKLRADTVVPVKVDGKYENVTVNDLISSYSGKKATDKRFNELNTIKKQYLSEKQEFDKVVEKIKTSSKNNPYEAFLELVELAGHDPVDYNMNFLNSVSGVYERWAEMSDTEKENYKLNQKVSRYEKRTQQAKQSEEQEVKLRELDQRLNKVLETHKMSLDEFTKGFETFNQLQQQGVIKKDIEATPEIVSELILENRAKELSTKVLTSVNPSLAQDETAKDIMYEAIMKEGITDEEDLIEIITETFGLQAHKTLSEKLLKTETINEKPRNPMKDDIWLSFDHVR